MLERKYQYKNGIIYVHNLDKMDTQRLHNATERFLKKVIQEKERRRNNGNRNKTRSINKK